MVFNKLFGKFKKTEVEDEEEIKVQDYLDMIAPSTIRFYTEYFICGNSYRSVWALREYPTSTDEQALLRYMGEKDGVTLHIYARQVTSAEEKKIIGNAANKNRLRQSNTQDLKETVTAQSNLNDVIELIANMHRNREPLVHCAVYFELIADSYDELKDYTYEFVCYITTSPPEKSSYEESVKNAVYTSLDYGKYMYTTSGVVDDVTDDNKEPTEWIKAEGINAGYIIGKGGSVKNVTINLENLDSSQFTADTKLYIVVYGRLTSLSVPTPDYFDLDNQGYLCNQGSLNTKQIVTVNADPETGEGTDVVMPDYYCVTSTAFNYKDYPEYKPKIFKNGAEMDTNKPFTDYLDKKLTPDYMYDYDMDKNGESGLAPDDFEKYEEQKKLDANFGSFDFGLDSIKSVFDGTSDFFKFLTASISILPTTFLTILISFFVIMLVIVVAKWIIP